MERICAGVVWQAEEGKILSYSRSSQAAISLGSDNGAELIDVYEYVFETVFADTPKLIYEAHRLRYQVYCIENSFEDPSDNPHGIERDAYDDHSAHGLLIHRASSRAIGTIRLVLHKPNSKGGCLPFHKVCRHPRVQDPDFMPVASTAELSRFAVSKALRSVLNGGHPDRGSASVAGVTHSGQIYSWLPALGLMRMAVQLAVAHRIQYFCAIMERSFIRMLGRCGIHFESIGPAVQYHGWRETCYVNLANLLDRTYVERPDVWKVITNRGRLRRMISSTGSSKIAPFSVELV